MRDYPPHEARYAEQYDKAHVLRAQGKSIRVIADELGVPKSTVGGWLRYTREAPVYNIVCKGCGAEVAKSRPHASSCDDDCRFIAWMESRAERGLHTWEVYV